MSVLITRYIIHDTSLQSMVIFPLLGLNLVSRMRAEYPNQLDYNGCHLLPSLNLLSFAKQIKWEWAIKLQHGNIHLNYFSLLMIVDDLSHWITRYFIHVMSRQSLAIFPLPGVEHGSLASIPNILTKSFVICQAN